MRRKALSQQIILTLLLGIFLASCAVSAETPAFNPTNTKTIDTALTEASLPTPTQTPEPTFTYTPTEIPHTPTPILTPTPQWVYHEPGRIEAPILLYHQVWGEVPTTRYQVSIPNFRAQMAAIKDLGFTPIPLSIFLNALLEGSELPEKPIVITFDDGHESVYKHAFPIMQEFGFPGTFYIVANRIHGSPEFVTVDQLTEMIKAGWEIGSHSYSHEDLTINHSIVPKEIGQSKEDLEAELGVTVETFAYPYGKIDSFTATKVSHFGYRAGMGLGTGKTHTWGSVFYLERIEIYGEYQLENFYEILSGE